jgi:CRISPR-associated protein Cas1
VRNRIVDIAERPARLRIERRQLIIDAQPHPATIPLEDLAVVLVSHPQVSLTHAVLAELAAHGGVLVACDHARMPVALMLPLAAHGVQTERFRKQLELSRPRQKRLWQQIVRAKIVMQAAVLSEQDGQDGGLTPLLSAVRSGDPANVEARAARLYWTALFGSDFRRDAAAADHNRLLNYGYAVLRAAVARAICAAGLHPSLGLHHHNRYNPWCLADDLMEPYRPLVDRCVRQIMEGREEVPELCGETRESLLSVLTGPVAIGGQQRLLFDALSRTAASLANVITGDGQSLELPTGVVDAAA